MSLLKGNVLLKGLAVARSKNVAIISLSVGVPIDDLKIIYRNWNSRLKISLKSDHYGVCEFEIPLIGIWKLFSLNEIDSCIELCFVYSKPGFVLSK